MLLKYSKIYFNQYILIFSPKYIIAVHEIYIYTMGVLTMQYIQ